MKWVSTVGDAEQQLSVDQTASFRFRLCLHRLRPLKDAASELGHTQLMTTWGSAQPHRFGRNDLANFGHQDTIDFQISSSYISPTIQGEEGFSSVLVKLLCAMLEMGEHQNYAYVFMMCTVLTRWHQKLSIRFNVLVCLIVYTVHTMAYIKSVPMSSFTVLCRAGYWLICGW